MGWSKENLKELEMELSHSVHVQALLNARVQRQKERNMSLRGVSTEIMKQNA